MLLGGEYGLTETREMHRRIMSEKYEGNIPFQRLWIDKIIIYNPTWHGLWGCRIPSFGSESGTVMDAFEHRNRTSCFLKEPKERLMASQEEFFSWSYLKFMCAVTNNLTKFQRSMYLNWHTIIYRRYKYRISTDLLAATIEVVGDFPQNLRANPLPSATRLTPNYIPFKGYLVWFIYVQYIPLEKTRVSGMLHHIDSKWLPLQTLSGRHGMTCHNFNLHQQFCKKFLNVNVNCD
jgi:hypothetical protein